MNATARLNAALADVEGLIDQHRFSARGKTTQKQVKKAYDKAASAVKKKQGGSTKASKVSKKAAPKTKAPKRPTGNKKYGPESPQQYKKRTGRCPRGMRSDGSKGCVKPSPKAVSFGGKQRKPRTGGLKPGKDRWGQPRKAKAKASFETVLSAFANEQTELLASAEVWAEAVELVTAYKPQLRVVRARIDAGKLSADEVLDKVVESLEEDGVDEELTAAVASLLEDELDLAA